MDANEYQKLAMRTAKEECFNPCNLVMGLTSNAGECADIVKKHLWHGYEFNKSKLMKEFGDLLWYIALGCEMMDVTMSDVMQMNITELKSRYPDGFVKEGQVLQDIIF